MRHEIKQSILTAAIKLAIPKGYNKISRDEIAEEAGCAPSVVSYHFGTMKSLRRAILGEAKRLNVTEVLVQAEHALHGRGRN